MTEITREDMLEIMEKSTEAQLRAIRSLRRTPAATGVRRSRKGKSNVEIVADVLAAAGGPLHINEIIRRAQAQFGRPLQRESLVSALTKKVLDERTFRRVGPNTFDLLQREPV